MWWRTIISTSVETVNDTNTHRYWWVIFIPFAGPQLLLSLFMIDTVSPRKNYRISNGRMRLYVYLAFFGIAFITFFTAWWGINDIVGGKKVAFIAFTILGLTPILLDRKYRIRKDTESQESGGKHRLRRTGRNQKTTETKTDWRVLCTKVLSQL